MVFSYMLLVNLVLIYAKQIIYNVFRVLKKSMHDALAACFHQQELVSESIVVSENTNNGRF